MLKNEGWFKITINIFLLVFTISIFFGSLEIYARFKYWGGSLKEKGVYSRNKKYTVKKETPVRIVCIGASTTHGGSNVDTNETYPFYLEEIINQRIGKRFVEVLNGGIPATSTEYHRDFIKERIDDQELDIIILHSLYNHFSTFYPGHYNSKIDKFIVDRNKVKVIYRWDRMNLAEKINIFLMEHSYFYTRLREKILRIQKKSLDEYYAKQDKFFESVPASDAIYEADSIEKRDKALVSFIDRYYKAVRDIILTAKSHNVYVILVVPPYPFFQEETRESLTEFRPNQYYNIVFEKAKKCLLKLGQRYNILAIDADDEFLQRGRKRDLFSDDVHLSAKGNFLLADIIAAKIINRFRVL